MNRIRFNTDFLQTAGGKIGRCADQMDDGLHDLHRVIEMLDEYGGSDIIVKCVRELERYERIYKRLQGQTFSLGKAIRKVSDSFEKREADTIKLGNQLSLGAAYSLDILGLGMNIPFKRVQAGKTSYAEYKDHLAEALKTLLAQMTWMAPAILVPEWLQRAAEEYDNDNHRQTKESV